MSDILRYVVLFLLFLVICSILNTIARNILRVNSYFRIILWKDDFMDNLYENIAALCKTHNILITKLEENCGISRNNISKWTKTNPSVDKVLRISEALNVSVNYLCRSNFYETYNTTNLFIEHLSYDTENNKINWSIIPNINDTQDEFDKFEHYNNLMKYYNVDYYKYEFQYNKEDLLDLDQELSICYFNKGNNRIYLIFQHIYVIDMEERFPTYSDIYHLAIQSNNINKPVFRECYDKKTQQNLKELYNKIYYHVCEKPRQKQFEDFITNYIG